YWQRHPSLSYLFTGAYVGPSAQAPRPDESGQSLLDLELAYRQLEKLSAGDQRGAISGIVRHLHTDSSGNPHRSEISFDKFWSPPTGFLGLIEFRAVESLPKTEWIAGVALLFRAVTTYLLEKPYHSSLKDWGNHLHDRYFLPTPLWIDLTDVLTDLAQFGLPFDPAVFREIWEWRFASLLKFEGLTVRRALEAWPLLTDTPNDGGTTSRFVDTSVARLEFAVTTEAYRNFSVYINGRELPFRSLSPRELVAGLRYRGTALYPSLHPKIPVQLPLELTLVSRETDQPIHRFSLGVGQSAFNEEPMGELARKAPLEPGVPGQMTCDLRIEESLFREE
ncbi:MAG TPA: transglutaminase family protein, partial [Chthoniobacterales bacterium]|nr:transglutaminase family protein [Chthoniobacterales bacterium]